MNEIKKGIAGGQIAAVMELNPYKTQLDVYLDIVENRPFIPTEATEDGQLFEPAIIKKFQKKNNAVLFDSIDYLKSHNINHIDAGKYHFVQDIEYPFLRAATDKIYRIGENDGILECKKTDYDLNDAPRMMDYLQIQWCMGHYQIPNGALQYLEFGKFKEAFFFKFDTELFAEMKQKAIDFWNNHILPRIPPEPVNTNDILQLYPRAEQGKVIEADIDGFDLFNQLEMTHAEKVILEKQEDELKEKLMLKMADSEGKLDAESLQYAGKILATYKNNKDSRKFDEDKFKAEQSVLYNQYLIEKKGLRVFRVKYSKEK
jgi:predicted phage-related endonuclease